MGAIPSPPWVANTGASRWIGQTTDSNGAPGLYTFQTTFDLLGFDPETVVLAGGWTTDNAGLSRAPQRGRHRNHWGREFR